MQNRVEREVADAMKLGGPAWIAGVFEATGDVYARVSNGVTYSWLSFRIRDAVLRGLVRNALSGSVMGKTTLKVGGPGSARLAELIVPHVQVPAKRAMLEAYVALRAVMGKDDANSGAVSRLQQRMALAEMIVQLRRGQTVWADVVAESRAGS